MTALLNKLKQEEQSICDIFLLNILTNQLPYSTHYYHVITNVFFNFALGHNISKVNINQGRQKSNRTCQPLGYSNDVKFIR